MTTAVGRLAAYLGLDVTGVEKGTRKASRQFNSFEAKTNRTLARVERGFGRLGPVLSRAIAPLAAAATIAGLARLTSSSLKAADAIGKTADKIGLTTDSLQELRFAASQAGVNQRTLDMAMQRFSRRVGEAAQGTGELKDTLKQYGIEARDSATGQTRNLDDALNDLANTIMNAESDQEALRIAFKAFDSEGAAVVNMLRNGAGGLEAYRAKARQLGLVMDEDLIRAAERTNDKFDQLSRTLSIKVTEAVVRLAPHIESMLDSLLSGIDGVIVKLQRLGAIDMSPVEQAEERIYQNSKKLNGLYTERLELVEKLQSSGKRGFAPSRQSGAEIQSEIEALDAEISALIDENTQLRNDNATIQKAETADLDALAAARRAAALAAGENTDATEEETEALAKSVEQAHALRTSLEERGRAMTLQYDKQAAYNAKLDEMIELHQAGAISTQTLMSAHAEAADELHAVEESTVKVKDATAEADRTGQQFADSMTSSLQVVANGFGDAIMGANSFTEALDNIIDRLARLAIDMAFQQLIVAGVGAMGNPFAGPAAGGGTAAPTGNTAPGPGGGLGGTFLHGGGIVGGISAKHLPHYHDGGMASNEHLAVLQKGEGVFTQEQMAAMGPGGGDAVVNMKIVNMSGAQIETNETSGVNGEREIEVLVQDAVRKSFANGGMDRVMQSSYGLSRKGVR